jgi:hypothetical protein
MLYVLAGSRLHSTYVTADVFDIVRDLVFIGRVFYYNSSPNLCACVAPLMNSRMDGALFTDGELCNRTDSLHTLGRSLPACASLLSISVVTHRYVHSYLVPTYAVPRSIGVRTRLPQCDSWVGPRT